MKNELANCTFGHLKEKKKVILFSQVSVLISGHHGQFKEIKA